MSSVFVSRQKREVTVAYINWLGFFFFFRMAVAVSSSSLRSAPEESLQRVSQLVRIHRAKAGLPVAYIKWVFFFSE
jgi:hypothetical protein